MSKRVKFHTFVGGNPWQRGTQSNIPFTRAFKERPCTVTFNHLWTGQRVDTLPVWEKIFVNIIAFPIAIISCFLMFIVGIVLFLIDLPFFLVDWAITSIKRKR